MSPEPEVSFAEQLEQLLEAHDYELPQPGDIRQGVVVSISPQGIIVDLGLKRDGIVQPTDLEKLTPEERAELRTNDEIPVYILSTNDADGLIVSIYMARVSQDWEKAEEMLNSGEIFEGEVIGYNKGGLIVPFGRLRGFIPASHVSTLTPNLDERQRQQRMAKMRGQKFPLKVIEVNQLRRRLVFSQRDAQKEWDEVQKQSLLDHLAEGQIVKGRVSSMRDFGVFVNLGGADGLIHVSELSWQRINHPNEVVKVGDEIEAYIVKLDRENQRISLSRKRILPNPWDTLAEDYKQGQLVEGKITRIVDYGAFVEIAPGVEGLLHVSQLSRGSVEKVTDVVREGENHLLRIVSLDANKQRIGLSLKAVTSKEQIEWMASRPDTGTTTPVAESKQPVASPRPAEVNEPAPEDDVHTGDVEGASE
ncbi:MAG: S1 RNA-binding domain-containing protein [Candidatus Promineifilaceae bacterium]